MILQDFCAERNLSAIYNLTEPWSAGEWSYATDGFVIVRVPRQADIPERKNVPDVGELLRAFAGPEPTLDIPEFPEPKHKGCADCAGRGTYNDGVVCEDCDGTGNQPVSGTVWIMGKPYNDYVLYKIVRLPGVKIAEGLGGKKPVRFSFDGGEGLIMGANI